MQDPDETYYEFKYPYVLPSFNIVIEVSEIVESIKEDLDKLTPREFAFLSWLLEKRNAFDAYMSMIHPAYPYLSPATAAELIKRKTVAEFYAKIRRSKPFKTIYNSEQLLSLLHTELRRVSPEHRDARYSGDAVELAITLGKRTVWDAQQAESERYLRIIEMIARLNGTNVDPAISTPAPGQSNKVGSVDRLLAQSEALILGRESVATPAASDGTEETP